MERRKSSAEIEPIILSSVFHEVDILFKEKVAEDLRHDYAKGSSKRTRATSDSL